MWIFPTHFPKFWLKYRQVLVVLFLFMYLVNVHKFHIVKFASMNCLGYPEIYLTGEQNNGKGGGCDISGNLTYTFRYS